MIDLIPAAQYLRMSTEKQEYSLYNQGKVISQYASLHGFRIVRTYSDAAKSGLVLRRREALRNLLSDVVAGDNDYRAVLVYDVSRWGRFQDTDESAHYEFLCRSSGVSVCYCSEPFENDGSVASALLKTLKRVMAGEFSRELGVHVVSAKKRVSAAGYCVGGRTPFGFRRKIMSESERQSRVLQRGEWKYNHSERLTLVHGPSEEVRCIRTIYRMLLNDGMSCREIGRQLNLSGSTIWNKRWTEEQVRQIVTNPVYAGYCVWGRTSQRLGGPRVPLGADQWTIVPNAYSPVISKMDFDRAKECLRPEIDRRFWTLDRVVRCAKELLRKEGKLTVRLFDRTVGAPGGGTLHRVGGFRKICALAGYTLPESEITKSSKFAETYSLCRKVGQELTACSNGQISLIPSRRPQLVVNGINVSLQICRSVGFPDGKRRWKITPHPTDRNKITIVGLLSKENTRAEKLFIFRGIHLTKIHRFSENDSWFKTGALVPNWAELSSLISRISHGSLPTQKPARGRMI